MFISIIDNPFKDILLCLETNACEPKNVMKVEIHIYKLRTKKYSSSTTIGDAVTLLQ